MKKSCRLPALPGRPARKKRVFRAFGLLALFLLLVRGVQAASVSWDGGAGDGNWYSAANWSPDGVPAPADDVLIASSGVVVNASSPAVILNSLTLGDGTSSATLRVSTSIAWVGTGLIRSSAVLVFDSSAVFKFASLTLERGGLLSQHGPVELSTVSIRLRAASFDLQAGSTVSANGRGFRGGPATIAGWGPSGGAGSTDRGANGAGHGAYGGRGSGNISSVSGPYGSNTDPLEAGSGGGGSISPCFGSPGGGLIRIDADTATVNGLISADGSAAQNTCFAGGGGGSGGAVLLRAGYLYGGGSVTVQGGLGGWGTLYGGGGGAGGRLAIRVSRENYARIGVSSTAGGPGPSVAPGGSGETGTVFFEPKIYLGVMGDGSLCSNANNWLAGITPQAGETVLFGSTNPALGCFWNIPAAIDVGSVAFTSAYRGLLRIGDVMNVTGSFDMAGGTVSMQGFFDLRIGGDLLQTGGRLSLTGPRFARRARDGALASLVTLLVLGAAVGLLARTALGELAGGGPDTL
ncbi:MAG: hypothetical protein AAB578_01460, partial [Elusimicrobiota bacterium]